LELGRCLELHEKSVYLIFSSHFIRPDHDCFQSEAFSAPNSQQAVKGAQSIASYHGFSGPVQVTYPDAMYGGPQQPAFVNTIVGLTGISHFKDLNGGTPNCVSITPLASLNRFHYNLHFNFTLADH
jgi:hypothetical protein